jgi:cytochrome c553
MPPRSAHVPVPALAVRIGSGKLAPPRRSRGRSIRVRRARTQPRVNHKREVESMKRNWIGIAALLAVPFAAAAQAPAGKGATPEVNTSMCTGCHSIPGYQASFPQVYRVPMIAGQHADYLVAALQAYKKGERRHPTMQGVARTLTEEQITALAAYYSSIGKK